MNEPQPSDDITDADSLQQQLKLLRQLAPSDESKQRLRKLIADEVRVVAQSKSTGVAEPWWRRRISIPVPLMIAACLVWLLPFVWWYTRAAHDTSLTDGSQISSHSPIVTEEPPILTSENNSLSVATVGSFRATYLCGVGQVKNTTVYSFEDSQR